MTDRGKKSENTLEDQKEKKKRNKTKVKERDKEELDCFVLRLKRGDAGRERAQGE